MSERSLAYLWILILPHRGLLLCVLLTACSNGGASLKAELAPDASATSPELRKVPAQHRFPNLLETPHAAHFTVVPGWTPPVTLPASYTGILGQCSCQLGFVPACREVCLWMAM